MEIFIGVVVAVALSVPVYIIGHRLGYEKGWGEAVRKLERQADAAYQRGFEDASKSKRGGWLTRDDI